MAADGHRRWCRRLAAGLGWLWALWFIYVGLPYRLRFLAIGIAVLLIWIAIGVWKGARRRSAALAVIGLLGAGWFLRAMAEVQRSSLDGTAIERPAGWYVFVGIEAGFALGMGLLSLVSWRSASRGSAPGRTAEPLEV